MTLQERLDRLEPRERRLLGVLVGVFVLFVLKRRNSEAL